MQGNSADAWKVGINTFLFAEGPIMKSQWILQTGFLKMLYLAELQISEKENWLEANKFVQLVVGRDDWRTRRRTQLGGLLVLGAASERQAEVFQLVVLGWSQNDLIQLSFRAQHTHTHMRASQTIFFFNFIVWATGRISHTTKFNVPSGSSRFFVSIGADSKQLSIIPDTLPLNQRLSKFIRDLDLVF